MSGSRTKIGRRYNVGDVVCYNERGLRWIVEIVSVKATVDLEGRTYELRMIEPLESLYGIMSPDMFDGRCFEVFENVSKGSYGIWCFSELPLVRDSH